MSDPKIIRTPAFAQWTKRHKWGPNLGDDTTFTVHRTDAGPLRISDGKVTITIPDQLHEWLAESVADAVRWRDDE